MKEGNTVPAHAIKLLQRRIADLSAATVSKDDDKDMLCQFIEVEAGDENLQDDFQVGAVDRDMLCQFIEEGEAKAETKLAFPRTFELLKDARHTLPDTRSVSQR
jgi:hypothetical protein